MYDNFINNLPTGFLIELYGSHNDIKLNIKYNGNEVNDDMNENVINYNILYNDIEKYYNEYFIMKYNNLFESIDLFRFENKFFDKEFEGEFVRFDIYTLHNNKHTNIISIERVFDSSVKDSLNKLF